MTESLPPVKDKSGLAVASLIIGIASFLLAFIPCIGAISSILGIVFGALSLRSSKKKLALAGLILSCVTLLFSIIAPIAGLSLLGPAINDVFQNINQGLQ